MAHAKAEDMKDLTSLLQEIRSIKELKEKSPGCFYFKSKGILHFHTKDGRRYAHVSDTNRWYEVDLPSKMSKTAQKNAFERIFRLLPLKKSISAI
jgi:hypothetical protein